MTYALTLQLSFNTQCSSQWDGFRNSHLTNLTHLGHWAYQANGKFYNGVTKDDIEGPNKTLRNGIHRIIQVTLKLI